MAIQVITADEIREMIGKILYLDDLSVIKDNTKVFSELNLSSIDFIDLCFELKKKVGKNVEPEKLWPFTQMSLDPELFLDNKWTQKGWQQVSSILNINEDTEPESVRDLYKRFTLEYIQHRLEKI